MTLRRVALTLVLLLSFLQGCSGNGFHLRESVELPNHYKSIYLQGLSGESKFKNVFEEALLEANGVVVTNKKQAESIIDFLRFEQDRRVIAYTNTRRAREYLVYLKIEYSIQNKKNKALNDTNPVKRRINIDRSYLYDPDFALGKAEEERQVIQALYEEATRLILLRIKYANK